MNSGAISDTKGGTYTSKILIYRPEFSLRDDIRYMPTRLTSMER